MTRPEVALPHGQRAERGSGLLSSVFGVAITLALVCVAAQITVALMGRTTVESVAYDAARRVATAPLEMPRADAEQRALDNARHLLGRRADAVELRFLPSTDDRVVLQVRAPGTRVLPSALGDQGEFGRLDRRIVLVRELP